MSHQVIVTKYFGPTNTRGSRVKASCEAGSVTVSWNHGAGVEDNHKAAARALIVKLGWEGNWAMGSDRHTFVFACLARWWATGFKAPHPQAVSPMYLLRVLPEETES